MATYAESHNSEATQAELRRCAEWLEDGGVLTDAPTPEYRTIPFLMVGAAQDIDLLFAVADAARNQIKDRYCGCARCDRLRDALGILEERLGDIE